MIKDGVISGRGKDEVGEFSVIGYHKNKKVEYNMTYVDSFTAHFEGTFDGPNKITGRHNIDEVNGTFELILQK